MRLVIGMLAASLAGCAQSGGEISRNFPVAAFDGVRLAGSDRVNVVTGPLAVTAAGTTDVLDRLDIRTDGAMLVIGRKEGGGMEWSGANATVTVSIPALRTAVVAGSGDMRVDRVAGSRFDGELTGSGSLALPAVEVAGLGLRVTGSGEADVAGRADAVEFTTTGSGGIDGDALTTRTAVVAVRGSGDVAVRASQSATLTVNGSGSARVKGTQNCSITKSGSGDARCD